MAASAQGVRVNINWLDAELFEKGDPSAHLENIHGIIVPGGFGERGAEGKIEAARYARAEARCRISASVSACRWR